ncbi:ATP-binding protein [Roseateles sp. BYS180W]|uniref:ATP-binding protein n=1 Tax=Roseateles rivi TaxID=3299028 RepID=A0ABW7FZD5_9BURK
MPHSTELFQRSAYAADMAQQLLRPSALQLNLRSGVFLSGIRRVGKTTFLRQDLVPALEALGALVIYVDLWSDRSKNPSALVLEAVRQTLVELQSPGSGLLQRLKGLSLGAVGLSFSFQVDGLGSPGGATLAQAVVELVELAKVDVVLMVDEVQHATFSDDGIHLLHAIKAARDAVNPRPDMPGHFIFLGTGSHKSLVTEMASRRTQPFSGAVAADYQVLGEDFVSWQLERIRASTPGARLPSLACASRGFHSLGHRPEELLKALVQLQNTSMAPDPAFELICQTLASTVADVELRQLDELGPLARLLFDRIAAAPERGATGLFRTQALADYSGAMHARVDAPQVQGTVDKLVSAHLIMRAGHGLYQIADPFLRQVWREHKALSSHKAAP